MSTPPSGDQGFGKATWGHSPWGSGVIPPISPPVITPLDPIDNETYVSQLHPIFIRLTDNSDVDEATIKISVGPTIYVMGGVAQNGAVLFTTANTGNGVDLELRVPDPFPLGSTQEVVVFAKDDRSEQSELVYRFYVGVGLRLIQVRNPMPGILIAYFNEPLLQDERLRFPASWAVSPVSEGAKPLEITEVFTDPNHTSLVTLRYVGGGSTYSLLASGAYDAYGNPIDPRFNKAEFDLLYGDEPDPRIRLFDTIYGPVGISQRLRLRRTMDDHVVSRSISLGMDEQFRIRLENLDGSAGRDGRPGGNRT
jgi:hypothetical protein